MGFALNPNNPLVVGAAALLIVLAIIFLSGFKAPGSQYSAPLEIDKSGFAKAPNLSGIAGYINTDSNIGIESLKGKVVLVDFWTYSCINCIRTLPYLNAWHEKYSDDGLVIIGVHSPEFEFEKDYGNVTAAVEEYSIKFPVVLDNDFSTWRSYNNHYWPHKFLIDAEGYIRYDHIGEGSYAETEEMIVKLLKEANSSVTLEDGQPSSENPNFFGIESPEMYFGPNFFRSSSPDLGNEGGFVVGTPATYAIQTNNFALNRPYLEGTWFTNGDSSNLLSDFGKVALKFKAKNANIVAGHAENDKEVTLKVLIDGKPATIDNAGSDVQFINNEPVVKVNDQRLYNIVSGPDYSEKTVLFEIQGAGFELYTFTFG